MGGRKDVIVCSNVRSTYTYGISSKIMAVVHLVIIPDTHQGKYKESIFFMLVILPKTYPSLHDAETLMQVVVSSHLDYCNAFFSACLSCAT